MTDFLAAEGAIRQLHARYIDAVFRKDATAFIDCFAEDAEWKIAGQHFRGRAEIAGAFERFMAPTERVLMLLSAPILEVGEGTASGRTYATENVKLADGKAVRTIGIYYERFVDQGDRWRFRWRHWSLYYYGPPDFSAPFYAPAEYGLPPGLPEHDEPTLARRDA